MHRRGGYRLRCSRSNSSRSTINARRASHSTSSESLCSDHQMLVATATATGFFGLDSDIDIDIGATTDGARTGTRGRGTLAAFAWWLGAPRVRRWLPVVLLRLLAGGVKFGGSAPALQVGRCWFWFGHARRGGVGDRRGRLGGQSRVRV